MGSHLDPPKETYLHTPDHTRSPGSTTNYLEGQVAQLQATIPKVAHDLLKVAQNYRPQALQVGRGLPGSSAPSTSRRDRHPLGGENTLDEDAYKENSYVVPCWL